MINWIKNIIKNTIKKGFKIGYSSGKPFDPYNQKRTSAMDDLLHPEKKEKRR